MRRGLSVALLLAALALSLVGGGSASAQISCGITSPQSSKGYVQQTVSSTPVGLTSVPAGTRLAVVDVETFSIRYRDDGTDPTASVGTLFLSGTARIVCGPQLGSFRMIRTSADTTVSVNYYGN